MKRTLVVLVPGHNGDPKSLAKLKDMLKGTTELVDALWLDFTYSAPWWSNRSPDSIAQSLSATIDSYVYSHAEEVGNIILAGHSMGTVILRRAFFDAQNLHSTDSIPQQWVGLVDRIVLMGAFGRGFNLKRQPFSQRLLLTPAVILARTLGFGKMKLAIFKGSDFIARLRIDWIRFNGTDQPKPMVVNLLGSEDIAIRPEDVIDLEQFQNAIPIAVANASHGNIVIPGPDTEGPLKRAFIGKPMSNRPVSIQDAPDKVFFLLHGIRDSRECFDKVGRQLDQLCPEAKVIVPDYGYLSARSFLNKRYRDKYVRWFVDQVAEHLARNPRVKFYFAGHSNGTYILGEALRRIPRLACSRVYIAASVLPRIFEWDRIIGQRKQAAFVRCDMGTEDWPVGVGCNTLNRLGMKTIGVGGFEGFEYGDKDHMAFNHFAGGHGSMLTDANTGSIADFLLTGSPTETAALVHPKPSKAFTLFRSWGDILVPLVLALLLAGIVAIAVFVPLPYGPVLAFAVLWALWAAAGRL